MSNQLNDVWLAQYYKPDHYETDTLFSYTLQAADHDILFRHALKQASAQMRAPLRENQSRLS